MEPCLLASTKNVLSLFEIGSHCVAWADLTLMVLLPQSRKCWDSRCALLPNKALLLEFVAGGWTQGLWRAKQALVCWVPAQPLTKTFHQELLIGTRHWGTIKDRKEQGRNPDLVEAEVTEKEKGRRCGLHSPPVSICFLFFINRMRSRLLFCQVTNLENMVFFFFFKKIKLSKVLNTSLVKCSTPHLHSSLSSFCSFIFGFQKGIDEMLSWRVPAM